MRALPAALALALLAPAALPAAAEPVERARVEVGHPLPGARAALYEDPACFSHEVLWQGAWFTVADALAWAWEDGSPSSLARVDDRAERAVLAAGNRTFAALEDAFLRAPRWLTDPLAPALWALGHLGDEDACLLRLAQVTTELPAPSAP